MKSFEMKTTNHSQMYWLRANLVSFDVNFTEMLATIRFQG